MAALAAVLVTSAVTVAVAAGCATSVPDKVTITGHTLSREQIAHLIQDADSTFRRAAHAAGAAINRSSRCFLTFAAADHSEAGDALLCGPVLMYGTARNDLWARMPVRVVGSGDLHPAAPDFPPRPRPAGLTLARPDGAQPDDGANLPAPRPPSDEPGDMKYISAADLTGIPMKAPTGDGLLLGPSIAAKVAAVGTAAAYGRGPDAHSAAAGEQFLFLQWAPTPAFATVVSTDTPPGQLANQPPPTVGGAVIAGATRHPLPTVNGSPILGGATLVVSVPINTPAYLEINDQGCAQRLNLRTGERVTEPEFTPIYRRRNHAILGDQLTGALTNVRSGNTIRFHLTAAQAALTPFDRDRGYAPPGSTWLAITITDSSTDSGIGIPQFAPNAFTITTGSQRGIVAQQVTVGTELVRLLAPVPPTTTTATLTCSWRGAIAFIGTSAARPSHPATLSVTIPA
ncbi:hypothetical protein [Fodinicola acaciae]|uniref:hypothetical protein n=1 Tax=Fodinicola acaciae TaxID=2681555 RepID=UPI0013CF57CB|nr:hypothetical protein [Fodinicola acaciae]